MPATLRRTLPILTSALLTAGLTTPVASAAITPDNPAAVWATVNDSANQADVTAVGGDNNSTNYNTGTFTTDLVLTSGSPATTTTLTSVGTDAYVASYSAANELNWVAHVTGSGTETVHDLATTPSGTIVIAGSYTGDLTLCTTALTSGATPGSCAGGSTSTSFPAGAGPSAFVAAYDSVGTLTWAHRAASTDAVAHAITINPTSGDVYAALTSTGDLTYGTGLTLPLSGTNTVLVHYNSTGTPQAANQINGGGTPTSVDSRGNHVLATVNFPGGATYDACETPFSGTPSTCAGGSNGIGINPLGNTGGILSYSPTLTLQWANFTDGSVSSTTSAGALTATGTSTTTGTASGNVTLCNNPLTPGNSYSGCPETTSVTRAGASGYVAHYSSTGTLAWVNTFSGTSVSTHDIVLDTYGRAHLAGAINGTPSFCDSARTVGSSAGTCAGGSGTTSLAPTGVTSGLYASYATNGTLTGALATAHGSPTHPSSATSIALTGNTDPGLVLGGNFTASMTLTSRGSTLTLTGTAPNTSGWSAWTLLAPTTTSVSPSTGTTAGGTRVTITGTGFRAGTTTVTFGENPCTNVTVVSDTSLTCDTPSGTAGSATVEVSVNGVASNQVTSFTYEAPAPTVTAISPSTGPLAGGNTVTITGTLFAAGATVTIGGNPCTTVSVTSATSLTCVAPAGPAGISNVSVTESGRTGTLPNAFTHLAAPTATAISPNRGALAGGNTVTITGTNFAAGHTTVTLGANACTTVTVTNATSLTCTTPAATAAGAVNVAVRVHGVNAPALNNAFTYDAAPTVTAITPNKGTTAGGTNVTITGTNFNAGTTTVTIGGSPCTSVTVSSATSLTCTTPARAAGPADVIVSVHGAPSSPLAGGYTYGAVPTITGVTPQNGPPAGGTLITITGTNFATGATVTVGTAACTNVTIVSTSTLTCTTGAGAAGAVNVTVTVNGFTGTGTNAFVYGTGSSVTSIVPANGPTAGGTNVTITGSNFVAGSTTVTIGTSACTGVTVAKPDTLTCTTPAGTAGTANVKITVNSIDSTLANGFTYVAPAAPEPPASANAVAEDKAAIVTWEPPVGPIASNYTVQSYTATATPGGATCTSAALTCTINGLENGTTYFVEVTATNAHGTSQAAAAGDVTPTDATIAISGKRKGNLIQVTGTTTGIPAGAEVTPMVSFPAPTSGNKTASADPRPEDPVTVRADGSFTWKRTQPATQALSVYFVYQGAESNVRDFPGSAAKTTITATRGKKPGTQSVITVRGKTNLGAGAKALPRVRLAGESTYTARKPVKVGKNGVFQFTITTSGGAYVFVNVAGVPSNRVVVPPAKKK